jgi:hypothetical protein
MKSLMGKPAENTDEMLRKQEQIRAERLERAKAEAATRGKEPFDLAKLETLVDPGRMVPPEQRQREYEYQYYVRHTKFTTLQDLANLIRELSEY